MSAHARIYRSLSRRELLHIPTKSLFSGLKVLVNVGHSLRMNRCVSCIALWRGNVSPLAQPARRLRNVCGLRHVCVSLVRGMQTTSFSFLGGKLSRKARGTGRQRARGQGRHGGAAKQHAAQHQATPVRNSLRGSRLAGLPSWSSRC